MDGSGNVYVAGYSSATWGSPVRAYTSPRYDAFAAKLTSAGALTWNTFLGGSGVDSGDAIAVDGSGNVYVAGTAAPPGAARCAPTRRQFDAFAAKLTSAGALTWNTFLGGSGGDAGYANRGGRQRQRLRGGTLATPPGAARCAPTRPRTTRSSLRSRMPPAPPHQRAAAFTSLKGQLQVGDNADDDAKDKLVWKFRGGPLLRRPTSATRPAQPATRCASTMTARSKVEVQDPRGQHEWSEVGTKGYQYRTPPDERRRRPRPKLLGGAGPQIEAADEGQGNRAADAHARERHPTLHRHHRLTAHLREEQRRLLRDQLLPRPRS